MQTGTKGKALLKGINLSQEEGMQKVPESQKRYSNQPCHQSSRKRVPHPKSNRDQL